MKYAAVIAAAGLSSRMHEFKPMLCLGEDTMISCVIRNLQNAGVEDIAVVTGYRAEMLRRHLEPMNVRVCENEAYAETKMFDSLCLGLRALEGDWDYVFLTPGDVPMVQPETIQRMQTSGARITRPICGEQLGHPVMLARELIPELLRYHGENGLVGAIDHLAASGVEVLDLPVEDIGIAMDADTPEDFKALRRLDMENRSGGRLWPDIHIHIAKGDTILTPETAQYLEMIGHTGSIQSACACMHMSYSRGWKLLNRIEKELGYPLVERFPGGVSGGGSVLTAKGRRLLMAYQSYRDQVRQMAEELFQAHFPEDLFQ